MFGEQLEKEFTARVLLHKVAICKGVLANKYIQEQKAQDIVLPDNYLEQNAMEYANQVVQDAMSKGMLDEIYEKAWNNTVIHMPDNFSIMLQPNTL